MVKVKQSLGSLNCWSEDGCFVESHASLFEVLSFCVDSVWFDTEAGAAVSKLRWTTGFSSSTLSSECNIIGRVNHSFTCRIEHEPCISFYELSFHYGMRF